jgi:RIO kinase 2
MKLDITVLRYLSREDWRILAAIELGMKNHDLVPTDLIVKIGKLHRGGTFKAISNLHKHKLIYHEAKICE